MNKGTHTFGPCDTLGRIVRGCRPLRGNALRGLGWLLAAGIVLAGCEPAPGGAIHTFTGETMGTTYTAKVAGELTSERREAVEQAFRDVLESIDRAMSTWRPDSEISRFNNSTSTEPMKVSPEFLEVLLCAREVSEASGGAFDVTVAPLVDAWGFGPQDRPERLPSDAEIEALKAQVGYEKLEIDAQARTIRKTVPGLRLDVGALAPGYGSDRMGRALERLGYMNYMIELGGEVRTAGRKADGSPWTIAIERPDVAGRQMYTSVNLRGESLSTSGDYRDYYEKDGVRYSHTLDPRTGRPITHNLASVSVIQDECMWADAYATALDVLGPEEGYALAEKRDIPALFLVRQAPGEFVEKATPEFRERLSAVSISSLGPVPAGGGEAVVPARRDVEQ
jgi:thiamine biosynthesis lipoprotein